MDQHTRYSVAVSLCLSLLLACLFCASLSAQIQNGQFTGTVSDPSGAAIKDAKVTVLNQATNLAVSTTTNQAGAYIVPQLPVGTYKITVEASGFKTTTTANATIAAGTIEHIDFKLQLGEAREVVEVSGEASQVNTEDSKLANTVGSTQIANLPLNGRNVYDLIRLAPGAVDTRTADLENDGTPGGAGTVVNGVRQDFNGFLINGVSNKALSGGASNQPIEDTVQEFQQLTLNMSAQYGNSAGSITNLVTKGGTNEFHGSGFYFNRNDVFDANNFFLNQGGIKKPPLRLSQFGGTFGGPIIKDKLFFFAAYQHDHFITTNTPTAVTVESSEWRNAVLAAQGTEPTVAGLLYKDFLPSIPTTSNNQGPDLVTYLSNNGLSGNPSDYLCPTSSVYNPANALELAQATAAAIKIGNVIGVTAADQAGCASPIPLFAPANAFPRTGVPFQTNTVALYGQQTKGNLFQGDEGSIKLDYTPSDKNRFSLGTNWLQTADNFFGAQPSAARGFFNTNHSKFPNAQFSFIHTFSPKLLNEFRAGYSLNIPAPGLVKPTVPGVPNITFDDGTMGFGSYTGYPQFFKENIYSYSDMVSLSHGNHNIKVGADFRRNIENSEFDVSRPSYYFADQLLFAGDAPYGEAAGVNPNICSGPPCTNLNPNPVAHLETNIRHWRNLEFGAYFQDDWKVSRRLTLNLGLRYDLFTRHNELNDLATTFLPGPGTNPIDVLSSGAGWVKSASAPLGTAGCPFTQANVAESVVAGVCGPGGFAPASSLGKGDHNDFGPRVGFAWDIFGDGKTSLRGGYGLSYEGTLYNPLSNSRWDPPYYSFNQAFNGQETPNGNIVIYGPQTPGSAPRFTGPPDPLNGQGPGGGDEGNLAGWFGGNRNVAFLTGIILPQGVRDPYVHNFFFGMQRELVPGTVLQIDYVGTAGHKLFRAQDINRIPGGKLPEGVCAKDTFGRTLCSQFDSTDRGDGEPINPSGVPNPNFGTLRNWQNVVNSNYNALQVQLKTQSWHHLTTNVVYTWSHSIDEGSTWHSGATTANGHAAGEEFSLDPTLPQLDRGNSLYDVRQRLVVNYVYDIAFFNHANSAVLRNVLGGWQWNGIWSFQTGLHWSPFCRSSARAGFNAAGELDNTGCDFNLDGAKNDRPNAMATNVDASHDQWANGFGPFFILSGDGTAGSGDTFFTRPCPGCVGSEGRNTFVGPKFFSADISLFKNIKFTERFGLQFRWEVFNAFNHTNFQLPGAQLSTNNRVTSATFGKAGGAFDARQMQFGLKLSF